MAQYIAVIETRSRVIKVEGTDDAEVAMDVVARAYDQGHIILTEADIDTGPHFEDETHRWLEDPDSAKHFTCINTSTYKDA